MKFLVCGGYGFIGSTFIKNHLKNFPNDIIINIDNLTIGSNKLNLSEIITENYSFINEDIKNFDEIEKINFDQLEQNIGESDCVVSSVPSSDSIKKIEGNLIVENLDRKVYKKITYPIYIKKDSLLSYLKSSEYSWNLKDALKELDFVIDSN